MAIRYVIPDPRHEFWVRSGFMHVIFKEIFISSSFINQYINRSQMGQRVQGSENPNPGETQPRKKIYKV